MLPGRVRCIRPFSFMAGIDAEGETMTVSRRAFLGAAGAAVAVAATGRTTKPVEAAGTGPYVCAFSKHLQFLGFEELAKAGKELGLDGFDLTVRKGGHVTPDKLGDLKKAVDVIRGAGLDIFMVTTNLNSGEDPDAEPILSAVAEHGIGYARVGGLRYEDSGNPAAQLDGFARKLGSLAKIAAKCGVTLGYHNHSGYGNFGAAIWDLERVLSMVDSPNLGSNFDAGHATVEGAYGAWEINTRLMAPRVKMMAVKDFVWNKNKPSWVTLGKGIVPLKEILGTIRGAGFAGPISIHVEYDVAGDAAMLEEMKQGAQLLRGLL